mmetsp:Transcript_66858/g.204743  ORF Transcript_66858/g.204743 Transcript_66858/m.204743 type:complete len:339 (+) Transcript_66858:5434-6450(+)
MLVEIVMLIVVSLANEPFLGSMSTTVGVYLDEKPKSHVDDPSPRAAHPAATVFKVTLKCPRSRCSSSASSPRSVSFSSSSWLIKRRMVKTSTEMLSDSAAAASSPNASLATMWWTPCWWLTDLPAKRSKEALTAWWCALPMDRTVPAASAAWAKQYAFDSSAAPSLHLCCSSGPPPPCAPSRRPAAGTAPPWTSHRNSVELPPNTAHGREVPSAMKREMVCLSATRGWKPAPEIVTTAPPPMDAIAGVTACTSKRYSSVAAPASTAARPRSGTQTRGVCVALAGGLRAERFNQHETSVPLWDWTSHGRSSMDTKGGSGPPPSSCPVKLMMPHRAAECA